MLGSRGVGVVTFDHGEDVRCQADYVQNLVVHPFIPDPRYFASDGLPPFLRKAGMNPRRTRDSRRGKDISREQLAQARRRQVPAVWGPQAGSRHKLTQNDT